MTKHHDSTTPGPWQDVMRTMHIVWRQMRRQLRGADLTPPQLRLLETIDEAGAEGMRLGDISKKLMVTGGNITGIVDRLEDIGYVSRHEDSADRRVIRAVITPAGKQLIDSFCPRRDALLHKVVSCLSPQEQELLSNLMQRLAASAEAMEDDEAEEDDGGCENPSCKERG